MLRSWQLRIDAERLPAVAFTQQLVSDVDMRLVRTASVSIDRRTAFSPVWGQRFRSIIFGTWLL
jgi:hypothetical protein